MGYTVKLQAGLKTRVYRDTIFIRAGLYVLEGELELTTFIGRQETHEVRNPYSETSADVLDVFWCPLGEGYLFDT